MRDEPRKLTETPDDEVARITDSDEPKLIDFWNYFEEKERKRRQWNNPQVDLTWAR